MTHRLPPNSCSILLPVVTFFNSISDSLFVPVLNDLTKGVGVGFEGAAVCRFPNDQDPDEVPFVGVEFSWYDECVVISTEEFRRYLQMVCEGFIREHPEDEHVVRGFLGREQGG